LGHCTFDSKCALFSSAQQVLQLCSHQLRVLLLNSTLTFTAQSSDWGLSVPSVPHFMCQSQVSDPMLPTLLSSLAMKSRVPTNHDLFQFNNLLEQLTKLLKTPYLLFLVNDKGYNSGRARWERWDAQNRYEAGHRATRPSLGSMSVHTHCVHPPPLGSSPPIPQAWLD
jgi:hypothetical protein